MKYLYVELKVCEGCGALWFRSEFRNDVYCKDCSTRLATFPAPRLRHAGGRPRTSTRRKGCCAARANTTATTRPAGGAR